MLSQGGRVVKEKFLRGFRNIPFLLEEAGLGHCGRSLSASAGISEH
jgi:hypothetical protein